MTFLFSKSTVSFFSGSSRERASTRLDVDLCLQTNGFGTPHPEAAAPHIAVLLEHKQQQRALQGRWKEAFPRLNKGMGVHCPGSIHYHQKDK